MSKQISMTTSLPTLLIVPTGVGCAIGGFAGDAIPAARLLTAASGLLITHPNVLNGASLFWSDPRVQYVEGYGIDSFAAGEIGLRLVRKQKIGLLFDSGIEPQLIQRHLDVANACRATLGLDIEHVAKTDEPVKISLSRSSSGSSWGSIENPEVLLRTADRLNNSGATAIAVVTRFPDEEESESIKNYRKGEGIDSFAGAEAVISHLLVKHLSIPCAHSPALNILPVNEDLDPRAAAEELGHTFLSCVLVGLSKAPDMVKLNHQRIEQVDSFRKTLTVKDLGVAVVPEETLGSPAVLSCLERGIPIIGVSNPGVISVNSQDLGIMNDDHLNQFNFFHAANYVEAAGLIIALREGIHKDSLYRPIAKLPKLSTEEM